MVFCTSKAARIKISFIPIFSLENVGIDLPTVNVIYHSNPSNMLSTLLLKRIHFPIIL